MIGLINDPGEVNFLMVGGVTLQGGTQIYDIIVDYQGCQLSPPKSFLSMYEIIRPLSHFNNLFCRAKSVCHSVFSNQYNSLISEPPL